MEQTVRQAAFFSDTLLNSLQRHMLRNERAELDAALTAVVKQPRMTELRLFDATRPHGVLEPRPRRSDASPT